jgi:hypothetical protein
VDVDCSGGVGREVVEVDSDDTLGIRGALVELDGSRDPELVGRGFFVKEGNSVHFIVVMINFRSIK